MSNEKSIVDSIVMLASQAGDRDSGTRLLRVQQLIDQCATLAGTDREEQLARLDGVLAKVKNELAKRPDQKQFFADVEDTIATKKRHIANTDA